MENKEIKNIEELEQMLHEAKKGIAKVDKTYVNYSEQGHLFQYNINFKTFLEDIQYILGNNNE
jgi:hypothetical protein